MILFGERDCVCDSGLQSRGKVACPDSVVQFCSSDSTKPILYNQGHYQITEGETMANLTNALQQLRAERREAQLHVEKLGQAISVIESLNGTGTSRNGKQATRIISAASRRKMARAQKARWAKVKAGSTAGGAAKTTVSASVKRTMSASARKKIAAAQRKSCTRVKVAKKKAA